VNGAYSACNGVVSLNGFGCRWWWKTVAQGDTLLHKQQQQSGGVDNYPGDIAQGVFDPEKDVVILSDGTVIENYY